MIYQRDPDAVIRELVGTLTFDARCSYALLLDLFEGGARAIPDDPRWISGVLGCSLRKWAAIRQELIGAGKIREYDGELACSLRPSSPPVPRQPVPSPAPRAAHSEPSRRFQGDNRRETPPKPPPDFNETGAKPPLKPRENGPGPNENNHLKNPASRAQSSISTTAIPHHPKGVGDSLGEIPPKEEPGLPAFLDRRGELAAVNGWNGKRQVVAEAIGGDALFDAWLANCRLTEGEGAFVIAAPNIFSRDRIANRFQQKLARALGKDVRVIVANEGAPSP